MTGATRVIFMLIRTICRLMAGSSLALFLPAVVAAQGTVDVAAQEQDVQSSSEIVVFGSIGYRYREDDVAEPVLVYDTDYFQRFEPLTAGDALKRVPSVTFLSDVIESDGARLRGLPPGYTQILINGERVPGSNADRSFFLDRIPAELVERVEIVRSSSARRTGDAVAGTLNIKLRDGYQIDGGYLRAGGLYFDDKEFKPSLGGVFGSEVGPGRLLIGLNFQGRHNPKRKFSLRYDDSPENNPNFAVDDFANREDQVDTRDGKDYSANISYDISGGDTEVALRAFYVHTDRTEDERSLEYNSPTAINGPVRAAIPGNLLTDNANVNRIKQDSYSIEGKLSHRWSLGKSSVKFAYASFEDQQDETEFEIDFDRSTPRFTGDIIDLSVQDREFTAKLDHEFPITDDVNLVVGGFYQDKDRATQILEDRNRFNLTSAVRSWDSNVGNPNQFTTPFDPPAAGPGNDNQIEERRIDGFALIEGKSGGLRWEVGVRYETTDIRIDDFTVAAASQRQRNDYAEWLPSASLKLNIGTNGRLTASAARTLRRPELNFISPALIEAELGDNDLLGNPLLNPETSWGGDIGYEHRIGRSGIAGVNFFYRDVSDLIELTNTLVEGSEGPGTFILQPQNIGGGQVWGVEFDLSTDLGFIGLPDTGVFGNISWLDSKIDDDFGQRRFNGQSKYVYNVGIIQDIKSWDAAFGATYRKQGRAFDRLVGEEIFTSYGADLEIFIEKRIGSNFTIRAVGSNLLDGSKDEVFNKFTTIGDQRARIFDEFELETESAGPVFQIMARFAF
jgi:iron complex outermembrane receptor protein